MQCAVLGALTIPLLWGVAVEFFVWWPLPCGQAATVKRKELQRGVVQPRTPLNDTWVYCSYCLCTIKNKTQEALYGAPHSGSLVAEVQDIQFDVKGLHK